MTELINGAVYKRGMWKFVLVYFVPLREVPAIHKWGMLHIHRSCHKGMSAPIFQAGMDGRIAFTEEELKKDWDSDNWIMLDGRLRIEKIDDKVLPEYTLGGELEPFKIKKE